MLLFAHIGPVIAVTQWYLSKPISQRRFFKSLNLNSVDWRIVWLAGFINDLLDKPLALFLFPNLGTTRHVFHTLIINMFLASLIFFSSKKSQPQPRTHTFAAKALWSLRLHLPLISLGMFCHLVFDWIDMAQPKTLFYPLLGWEFERASLEPLRIDDYLLSLLTRLYERPMLVPFEIVGIVLMFSHLRWIQKTTQHLNFFSKIKLFFKVGNWPAEA